MDHSDNNIIVDSGNPTITAGAGGTIRLFTGNIDDSTDVETFATSSSYKKYESDESTVFSPALGTGTYVIYRIAGAGGGDPVIITYSLPATASLVTGTAYTPPIPTFIGGTPDSYGLAIVDGDGNSVKGEALSGTLAPGTYYVSVSGVTGNFTLDANGNTEQVLIITSTGTPSQPNSPSEVITAIINNVAIQPPVIPTFTPLAPSAQPSQQFSLGGQQIQLLGTPMGDTPTQLVGMQKVRGMLGGGAGDIRIPLGQNSLIQLINGGVRLPNGLEQEFFMAQR